MIVNGQTMKFTEWLIVGSYVLLIAAVNTTWNLNSAAKFNYKCKTLNTTVS